LFLDSFVECLKISRDFLLILTVPYAEGIKFTLCSAHTAADAPFLVNNRHIILQFNGFHWANVNAFPASHTLLRVSFSDKIDGHQLVPRNLPPPYTADIPAGATTAITIVLYFSGSVVHKMNQSDFRSFANCLPRFLTSDFFAKPMIDQVVCHLIEFEADLKRMLAGSSHQTCLHPAGAMSNRETCGIIEDGIHLVVG
jgi:hypothetical protein